jgi:hypothetical protein
MAGDPEGVETIRKSFYAEVEKLPETMEGLGKLITDLFWALFWLGMDNRRTVSVPVLWADQEVGGMLASVFATDKIGLSLEEENWPWIERLRAELIAQASEAAIRMELNGPFLEKLELAGKELRNTAVPVLIRDGFGRFASEMSRAWRELEANLKDSPADALKDFPALASLSKGEIGLIMRATETGKRGMGAVRLLAAELAGKRCGLDVSSVLKYAQPGRPRATRKRKI